MHNTVIIMVLCFAADACMFDNKRSTINRKSCMVHKEIGEAKSLKDCA